MSWGFLCDLAVTLPKADFKRVWKTSSNDHELPTPLFGFKSAALEQTFNVCGDSEDEPHPKVKFRELPAWFGSIARTTEAKATTTFRGLMHLDRGADPWIARAMGALLHAARPSGAGHLLLVNDGSYSGESGVFLQLADGEISSARLTDSRPLAAVLGPVLWEGAKLPSASQLVALALGKPKKSGKR